MSLRRFVAVAASVPRAEDVLVMHLRGQLGNQLFQFAMGTALSRRHDCPLRFEEGMFETTVSECVGDAFVLARDVDLLRCAQLRATPVERWACAVQQRVWLPWRRARHQPERHLELSEPFGLDPRVERVRAPCLLAGYFQRLGLIAEVLDDVTALIAEHLGLQHLPPGGEAGEVVGLHFRRGDYVPRGWELPMDYYDAALARLDRELTDPCLRVFADDRAFAQLMVEHLRSRDRRAEVATDPDGPRHPSVATLVDLAACDHVVIANSTLSWWAAVLGDRLHAGSNRLVISPDRWRREQPPPDLLLPGWHAVPAHPQPSKSA